MSGTREKYFELVTEAFYLCHVYEKTNVVEVKADFQKTHFKEKRDPIYIFVFLAVADRRTERQTDLKSSLTGYKTHTHTHTHTRIIVSPE